MRALSFLFLAVPAGLLQAAPDLSPGQTFPSLTLPRISDHEASSTAGLAGHKTILHVFASW